MKAWIGVLLALVMAPCTMAQQVKPACTDDSRQCMITAAKSYLEGLVHHDGSKVLLAPNVIRSEQGHVNTRDEASLRKSLDREPAMVGYSNLRFVVDTETHQLVYYTLLGLSMRADQVPAGTPAGAGHGPSGRTVQGGARPNHRDRGAVLQSGRNGWGIGLAGRALTFLSPSFPRRRESSYGCRPVRDSCRRRRGFPGFPPSRE